MFKQWIAKKIRYWFLYSFPGSVVTYRNKDGNLCHSTVVRGGVPPNLTP